MGDHTSQALLRFIFARKVAEIGRLVSATNTTTCVSLYLPAPLSQSGIARASHFLRDEIGKTSSIKRSTQQEHGDAASAAATSAEAPDDKARRVVFELEPIEPVKSFAYRCDSFFLVQPLLDMVDTAEGVAYGFLVVDGSGAIFANVRGNRFDVLQRVGDPALPNKHRRGGQSAGRYFRARNLARSHYVNKIAEMATSNFIDPKSNLPTVEGLFLAGLADFKVLVNVKLDPRLRKIVRARLDTSYGGTQGLTQAIVQAAPTLQGLTLQDQAAACADFFDHIASDDSRAVYGATSTIRALEEGAVETLLLWTDCPLVRHEISYQAPAPASATVSDSSGDPCTSDRELVEIVFCAARVDPLVRFADILSQRCLAMPSRSVVRASQPLVDYLADHATTLGAEKVQLVAECTAEGSQFCSGFGGIGGICRWAWTDAEATAEVIENVYVSNDEYDPLLDDEDDADFDISAFA